MKMADDGITADYHRLDEPEEDDDAHEQKGHPGCDPVTDSAVIERDDSEDSEENSKPERWRLCQCCGLKCCMCRRPDCCKIDRKKMLKEDVRCASLVVVYVTVFLDIFSWGILNPIIPYIAIAFKADAFQVGILNSVYSFCQMIGAFALGWLSDRVGRRPVLLICLLCSALSLTATVFVNSLWSLMLIRGVAGLFAGSIATACSYISDVTKPAGRGQFLGYIGIPIGLGMVLGPAFGGPLGMVKFQVCPILGYHDCIDCGVSSLFAGGCNVINFLLAIKFVNESLDKKDCCKICCNACCRRETAGETPLLEVAQSGDDDDEEDEEESDFKALYALAVTFISLFISNFFFCMFDATAPLFLYHAWFPHDMNGSTFWNGIGFAVFGMTMAILQAMLTGPALTKFGERWVIFISCTLRAICFLSFFWVPGGPVGVVIALFLVAGSGALNYSAFQTLLPGLAIDAKYGVGAVIGFGQTTIALARATAPLAGGYLFDFDRDSTILMNLFHIQTVQDIYPGHEKYEQLSDSGDVIFLAASIGTALVAVLISFLPFKYGAPKPAAPNAAKKIPWYICLCKSRSEGPDTGSGDCCVFVFLNDTSPEDTGSTSPQESESAPQSEPSPGTPAPRSDINRSGGIDQPHSDFKQLEEPSLYPQSELSPEVSPLDQADAPFEDV